MSNLFCFLDVEIHLDAMGIGDTIKAAKKKIFKNPWDYAKTMIFLYHHLHQALGSEFLAIKNLYILWNGLYERYSHLKSIILPNTRNEWIKLKLQDFKTIDEYNSTVLRITSQLKLCGDKITDEDIYAGENIHNFPCLKYSSTAKISSTRVQEAFRPNLMSSYSREEKWRGVG